MISIFICLFIVVLSFNFFMVSYQINGINRLVTSMPLSLFETAIDMFEIDEDIGPTFDKGILLDNLSSYFDYHFAKYTDEYGLYLYYYKPSDHSIDMSDYPKAVEVTVTAKIVLNNYYQKEMFYGIRSD